MRSLLEREEAWLIADDTAMSGANASLGNRLHDFVEFSVFFPIIREGEREMDAMFFNF